MGLVRMMATTVVRRRRSRLLSRWVRRILHLNDDFRLNNDGLPIENDNLMFNTRYNGLPP